MHWKPLLISRIRVQAKFTVLCSKLTLTNIGNPDKRHYVYVMAESHVVTALIDKYAEISGKLLANESEGITLRAALAHLDAAIHLFKGDYDVRTIAPRRKYTPSPHFERGGYSRVAMDVLREATEPLTAREIARLALERQGIHNPDNSILEKLRPLINGCMNDKQKQGRVTVHSDEYPKRFSAVCKTVTPSQDSDFKR